MLLHIPDVLSAEQVAYCRHKLDSAEWTDGRETVGTLGAQVKHNLQLPETSPLKRELGETILVALAKNPLFFSATLPLKYLPPRFNLYAGGGTITNGSFAFGTNTTGTASVGDFHAVSNITLGASLVGLTTAAAGGR